MGWPPDLPRVYADFNGVITHDDHWGWIGLIEGEICTESEWRRSSAHD